MIRRRKGPLAGASASDSTRSGGGRAAQATSAKGSSARSRGVRRHRRLFLRMTLEPTEHGTRFVRALEVEPKPAHKLF